MMPDWSFTEAYANATPLGRVLLGIGFAAFLFAVFGGLTFLGAYGAERGWWPEGTEVSDEHTAWGRKQAAKSKRQQIK